MPPSRDQVLKSKFVVDSIVIKKNKKEISNDRQLLLTPFNTLSLSITLSHCVLNYLYRPDCWLLFGVVSCEVVFVFEARQQPICLIYLFLNVLFMPFVVVGVVDVLLRR